MRLIYREDTKKSHAPASKVVRKWLLWGQTLGIWAEMRIFVFHYFTAQMESLHIITPVKDSIESTLRTAKAILDSHIDVPFSYTIYNDFSTEENTRRLEKASREMGFTLVNLADLTSHPSPNYLMVLRREQQLCWEGGCHLLIVESDVTVRPDTLQELAAAAARLPEAGIVAAVTVDEKGDINYPYDFAQKMEAGEHDVRKHLSFCCSLLTNRLLERVDFGQLDETKNWFDVTISHESLEQGLHNYLLTRLPVLHQPHGSRPWKKLKYTNPLKYYLKKYFKGMDKI